MPRSSGPRPGSSSTTGWGTWSLPPGRPSCGFPLPALEKGQEIVLEFRLALNVQPGAYTLSLDAAEFDEENPTWGCSTTGLAGLGP